MNLAKLLKLGRGLEPLKSMCKPVLVRAIPTPVRQMNNPAVEALQGLKNWPIVLRQQAVENVRIAVWIDSNQVTVDSRQVDFETAQIQDQNLPQFMGWQRRTPMFSF